MLNFAIMIRKIFVLLGLLFSVELFSQVLWKSYEQKHFRELPHGNYSGLASIGKHRYVMVSDKTPVDGFFITKIDIDSISGDILSVKIDSFIQSNGKCRDAEGIAFYPDRHTVFIAGEADNEIFEYMLDGGKTGRKLAIPEQFRSCAPNYGLESLSYNDSTKLFWTTSESTLPSDIAADTVLFKSHKMLRLQSFTHDLLPSQQYLYLMDTPLMEHRKSSAYAHGVSELLALDNGSLLVLEREFYVPMLKIGAFVVCKLYAVNPKQSSPIVLSLPLKDAYPLEKKLVYQWRTSLSLFGRSLANYEGMCLGPRISNGKQVVLLISDSQNGYAGVLKDWFKSIVIE